MTTGGCLCGAVRYEISGDIQAPSACHCSQCRKTSGHYWAGASVKHDVFTLTKTDGLKWFDSSDWAKRGFCCECGSSLFYQMNDADYVSISPASMDNAGDVRLRRHIFVKDKADYYDIGDGLPQIDTY